MLISQRKIKAQGLVFFVVLLLVSLCFAKAENVTGAGASFPYPIYSKWASEYAKQTGDLVNYQSIGSGGGQRQIIGKTVDFGASDNPMSVEKLEKNKLIQFPLIIGGIVPVINITGIKSGQLKLTGPLLADIYMGKIKRWSDPALKAINPDLNLPDMDIVVVHRSDGSGTTYGFTTYLAQVSPAWKEEIGAGKAIKWPVGQGGKGNAGLAAYVSRLRNSIGYVEFLYANKSGLALAQLQNKEGNFVLPSVESFSAAAKTADWSTPGMAVDLSNAEGEKSWPLASPTFILMNQEVLKPNKIGAAIKFFDWALGPQGSDLAHKLQYITVPQEVADKIKQTWKSKLYLPDGSPFDLPQSN